MHGLRTPFIFTLVFLAGWFAHQILSPLIASSPISNSQLSENKNNAVIYQPQTDNHNETMFINQVSVIQDRPEQLMLEVNYTYRDSIPASQMKLFVYMGSSFTYIGTIDVLSGTHKRRVSIGIIESEMKKAEVFEFETHDITLSFEHYAPDKYRGPKVRTPFAFHKRWMAKE